MMEIGKAIRVVRTIRGTTQRQLAENVGCTPNYVSLVERGVRQPTFDFVERVSDALNVPPAELVALSTADAENALGGERQAILQKLRELLLLLNELQG